MDHFNKLKANSRFNKRSQAGQDQTTASASSSSAILPGSSTTTTKIDDGTLFYQQPPRYSDQATALVSTLPSHHSNATELGVNVTIATASPLETATQSTLRTSGPTASQGSSRPAADTIYPAQVKNQSEDGIPARHGSLPHSGFFAGAKDVDASYGNFTDVAGDNVKIDIAGNVNIKVENKGNDMSALNKLPRTKDAGYRSEHHRKCLPGTRRAELERIEKWEVDPTDKRVYWLNGHAGSGKSTIAQTFAERSAAKGRLGASFFCSRDFPDRRNIHLIFPTIAFGLAHRYPEFREALMEILSSSPDAADESLAIQLEDLLIRPLISTKLSTTIVIDALDECEDKEPASAILSLLARHIGSIPSVKFFITGRPEVRIRTGFRLALLQPHTEVFVLHDVDPSSVNRDIELYLRTCLSEIASRRSDLDLTEAWPADDDIAFLVRRCSGFFIVASIIARLIGDHLEPQEQLKDIITEAESTIREGRSGVDEIYQHVLLQSLADVDIHDINVFDRLRLVVGSIVLVFNPLSCVDLAKMLDIPQGRVRSTIRSLHSVLIVPDSNAHLLRICHKSFADFLINPSRCVDRRFYVERSILHTKLGMHCLRLMNGLLKKNMCSLPPYTMNKDIEDLDARREQYIGSGLEYACKSWAKHLQSASRDGDDVGHVVELLERFFRHHLLSWLEVLSIVGDMRCAVYSLRDMRGWFADVGSSDTNLLDIITDSERFILRFFDAIEASPCHLYHSALPWSPRSSLVRTLYQDQISTEVKMLNAVDDSWDASMRTIQMRSYVYDIAFSYQDDLIAVSDGGFVEIFETSTGQRRATFTRPDISESSWSLSFSPDDTLLATGYYEGIIDVWDLETGGLVCSLAGHTKAVGSVAFSPCGTMIASCSRDNTVRIWNVLLRSCRCVLEGHSDDVSSVCWSATRDEVISGSNDRTVRVWDIDGMKSVKIFYGHASRVVSVACSPDSSVIASGSEDGVKIFNVQTGNVFQTISTDGPVDSIRFLDQNTLMYATYQSTFVIQDLSGKSNTQKPKSKNWLKRYLRKAQLGFKLRRSHVELNPTDGVNAMTFKYQGGCAAISSDGTRIASRTTNNTVTIWQTDGPSPTHDMDKAGHHNDVISVALSGDGRLVASGSEDSTSKLWDPITGRCLHTFSHTTWVDSVIFSPDSTLLASKAFDRTRIWDTRTYNLISTCESLSFTARLVFSPNGNRLLSLARYLELWEVATGKCLASLDVDKLFDKVVFCVDGTSVILENTDPLEVVRYGISPAHPSSSNDDKDEHSSLPLEFVPLHDTQQSQAVSAHLHCYRFGQGNEWIIDEQKRRVLWVPPDVRYPSDFCGKKVVLGSRSGRVTMIDFLDV